MKTKIGSLEVEVPKATLGKAKRLALLLAEPVPGDPVAAFNRPGEAILILIGDANPGLTADAIIDQIDADASFEAIRSIAVASGAWKAAAPGEAGSP